jgi:acetyltransferase-like isoleucine patch superfamily enzyme
MDIADVAGGWDYSTLPTNIRFGAHCYFECRQSFEHFRSKKVPGLVIGDRVNIYNWAALSAGEDGYIEIGDDSVLVGPVFWCGHRIVVGRNVVLSYNVMIADSDFHPKDPILRKADAVAVSPYGNKIRPPIDHRPVIIEDNVTVGIGAIVLKGVTIGAGATVLAGAVVSRNVPPGATAAGNPSRIIEASPGE